MAQLTPGHDPTMHRQRPLQTPAGRRSSDPVSPPAPGGQPDPIPVIMSPGAAAQALCDQFLANADRGDHAANDELVTELLCRIRSRQATWEPSGSPGAVRGR